LITWLSLAKSIFAGCFSRISDTTTAHQNTHLAM
jgi:hypothetical protein